MSDDNTQTTGLEQIPVNCTFTINKDDLPAGSDSFDISDHTDDLVEIVRNSWKLEEWVEEIASSRIQSDYEYDIEKGMEAYENFENLDLDDFDEFTDLKRRVNALDSEDGDDENNDITRLWKEVHRLSKTLAEVSRLFATWATYDRQSAEPETLEFFGSAS